MQYETKNLICHQQISTFAYKNRDTVRNLMTLKKTHDVLRMCAYWVIENHPTDLLHNRFKAPEKNEF